VVLETSPGNYATEVATTASITVTFNIDLDSRYIQDYVYLTDARGVHIDSRIVYKRKTITVTPLNPLDPGKTYQLFVIGDSDLTDNKANGIRSIVGDPMPGNFILTFTTDGEVAIEPPTLTLPGYGSVMRQNPIFAWEPVDGAVGYNIRISKSNRFDVLVFPENPDQVYTETEIEPAIIWDEGIHYWSVRAIREDGVKSEWSDIGQFNINMLEPGKISEEDAPPVDVLYETDPSLELIEVFPRDEFAGVPTNVKSIYFRVIGEVDVSLIDVDSFRVIGSHVTGDYNAESHGEVKGTVSIAPAGDGTTYIIFTPEIPPAPSV